MQSDALNQDAPIANQQSAHRLSSSREKTLRAEHQETDTHKSSADSDFIQSPKLSTASGFVQSPKASAYSDFNQSSSATSNLKKEYSLKKLLMYSGIMLILAFLFELLIFNAYYLRFDRDKFPTRVIELPYIEQIQKNAALVNASNPVINISGIDMYVRSIRVESYGGGIGVKGSVQALSESSAYTMQMISSFYTASGLNNNLQTPVQDYQKFLVKFDISEKVKSIALMVDKNTLSGTWVITKIEINPAPELNISLVRLFLIWLGFMLLYVVLFSKLYQHQVWLNTRAYKLLNHGIFALMLAMSCGVFAAYHPYFATDIAFKFIALGGTPYTTPNRTILQEIPSDQKTLGDLDPYIQLTDALLVKHQLNLDLWVDPALMQLDNVYDRTERMAKNIQFYWDRAFYNGKYYCYYGLAPVVMIYGPIYLLTGLVPCPAFAIFIAALWTLLGLHMLSSRLLNLFCTNCNTLLFTVTKTAMFMSSFVFFLQAQFMFYSLPYLLGMAFTCIALSLGLGLWFKPHLSKISCGQAKIVEAQDSVQAKEEGITASVRAKNIEAQNIGSAETSGVCAWLNNKLLAIKSSLQFRTNEYIPFSYDIRQMLAMIGCGLSVVLVVMSRPLLLLFLIVGLGVIYLVYLFKAQQSPLSKLVNSLCLLIPVFLGAIVISAYNYARFDSIFEFGAFKQLTVDDVNHNTLNMNFEYLKTMIFSSMIRNLEYISAFPFVGGNQHVETYTGQYQFISEHFGLLEIPYYWGLFLLPVIWGIKHFATHTQGRIMPPLNSNLGVGLIKTVISLWYVLFAVILGFTFYNAGWGQRYLCDITMLAVMIPLLAVTTLRFNWNSIIERIFYLSWIAACLMSCALMFFLVINNGGVNIEVINPRLFIRLKEIFDPLSFS